MGFSVDYEKANAGMIERGTYEVVIKKAFLDTTKNGISYISIPLIVRNDVEQKHKGQYIWHSMWKRKEPSPADSAVGGFGASQIQTLSKAAGLPNGKSYAGIEEWLEELTHKPIKITVGYKEYNGKMQLQVGYINVTEKLPMNHQFKAEESAPDGFIPVKENDDDDIPF